MSQLDFVKQICNKNNLEYEETNDKYIIPYFYEDIEFTYTSNSFTINDILSYDVFIHIFKDENKNHGILVFNFNLPKYNMNIEEQHFIATLEDLEFAIKYNTDLDTLKPQVKSQLIFCIKQIFDLLNNYNSLYLLQNRTTIRIKDVNTTFDKIYTNIMFKSEFELNSKMHRIVYNSDKNKDVTNIYNEVIKILRKNLDYYGVKYVR